MTTSSAPLARAAPDPGPMTQEEFGAFLNQLLEAERAGAKLLSAYLDELSTESDAWGQLRLVQRDEARNCAVLIHFLLETGVAPSMAVGDFYRKGLQIRGLRARLEFLNRGQAWVARRIAAVLPSVPGPAAQKALQTMHQSHLANIGSCAALLRQDAA
jgi:nitronate monooxygenase